MAMQTNSVTKAMDQGHQQFWFGIASAHPAHAFAALFGGKGVHNGHP